MIHYKPFNEVTVNERKSIVAIGHIRYLLNTLNNAVCQPDIPVDILYQTINCIETLIDNFNPPSNDED